MRLPCSLSRPRSSALQNQKTTAASPAAEESSDDDGASDSTHGGGTIAVTNHHRRAFSLYQTTFFGDGDEPFNDGGVMTTDSDEEAATWKLPRISSPALSLHRSAYFCPSTTEARKPSFAGAVIPSYPLFFTLDPTLFSVCVCGCAALRV
ncbi:hypothetical protein PIB30_083645 [Stylosanthes scabra]|uniref:Uncharacterized protein n=1 Tax=Stylosanthes scabra TaxID=79078 RepID=A0ABU6ZQY9_9FABA|nr:hypothetical protein [Stylosanthes scabra]